MKSPVPMSRVMAESMALQFFGVRLPITPDELKSSFRQACKRLHTDTSGRDTKDEFIKMKAFYDDLVSNHADASWLFTEATRVTIAQTVDGTPLTELGLGLGPFINGRDCEVCLHKGYTSQQIGNRCDLCRGLGYTYTYACQTCNAKGTVMRSRPFRVLTCPTCYGGCYITPSLFQLLNGGRMHRCPKCKGHGSLPNVKAKVIHHRCTHCQGAGEIEIFNPVLPKGRMVARK